MDGKLLLLVEVAEGINKPYKDFQDGRPFNSVGKLEISEVALEELFQNALVHREYIKTAPIRLLVFRNRVEIVSPGCLPDGLTVDDIKLGNSFQRNPLIATFCAKTMFYRGLGSGVLRSLQDGAHIDFINNETGKQFTAVINKTTQNTTQNNSRLSNLTTLQRRILEYIAKNPLASRFEIADKIEDATVDGVKYSLARLQDLNLIRRVGSKRKGYWKVVNDAE